MQWSNSLNSHNQLRFRCRTTLIIPKITVQWTSDTSLPVTQRISVHRYITDSTQNVTPEDWKSSNVLLWIEVVYMSKLPPVETHTVRVGKVIERRNLTVKNPKVSHGGTDYILTFHATNESKELKGTLPSYFLRNHGPSGVVGRGELVLSHVRRRKWRLNRVHLIRFST